MKNFFILTLLLFCLGMHAQVNENNADFIKENYPSNIDCKLDIVYKTINGTDLKLDIYRLSTAKNTMSPIVIAIHGGAWLAGTKKDDFYGNVKLFNNLLKKGFAIVSIDYRLSQVAKFPAQIQDCNDAIDFIYKKSKEFNLDKNKISVFGGSAGGHLVALLGTTNNHTIPDFYTNGKKPAFKINAVVDLFGPSDFIAMRGNSGAIDHDDSNSAEAQLLGFSPLVRPDLAKIVSPTTYVDKQTPPFLILHGDKDPIVQFTQSILLHSYLDLSGIKNKFINVKGAGHGGSEFGSDENVNEIVDFLSLNLKN
jgi:acetyl esterase/lipase